jgi:MarR family transcriptional regulator, lower aerobic nicotinate degradation pathway regulator
MYGAKNAKLKRDSIGLDMTLNRWQLEPGYLFRRSQQIAVAVFSEECDQFGLTCLQYSALSRIRETPGIDVTRLSEIMEFDRSTLGGVVERLEIKGYIRRSGTIEDKRIKLLEITRQGQAILAQIEPHLGKVNRRILSCFTAEEQRLLSKLLTHLIVQNVDIGKSPPTKAEPNVIISLRSGTRAKRRALDGQRKQLRYAKSV